MTQSAGNIPGASGSSGLLESLWSAVKSVGGSSNFKVVSAGGGVGTVFGYTLAPGALNAVIQSICQKYMGAVVGKGIGMVVGPAVTAYVGPVIVPIVAATGALVAVGTFSLGRYIFTVIKTNPSSKAGAKSSDSADKEQPLMVVVSKKEGADDAKERLAVDTSQTAEVATDIDKLARLVLDKAMEAA